MNQHLERASVLSTRTQVNRRAGLAVAAAIAVVALVTIGTSAAWAGAGDATSAPRGYAEHKHSDVPLSVPSTAEPALAEVALQDQPPASTAAPAPTNAPTLAPSPEPTPVAAPTLTPMAAPVAVVTAPTLVHVPAPIAFVAPIPVVAKYPLHTNIVSTTFWVGEIFDASLPDGSQMFSTYDAKWFANYGGCDGVASSGTCRTETRRASNGFFPTSITPKQNPFYLDLPFDDLNDKIGFAQRCTTIPWAAADNAASGINRCNDKNHSYMKNAWVEIKGPNGATCYGQVQDAGPSSGTLYHDANYVFGTTDARPENKKFSGDKTQGAGMDVSPALNGCLGFASLDGDSDKVSWRFVDRADVPAGPWLTVVTTSQVKN
ncbi:hypothetical protein QMG83_09325 [Salinibacterium sp. G-O1]|uniref:hypothetical protein n=1 Tax=Salinibacterium sp. G-O1 TaxID=3046208 RepID=UPI0024B99C89|nr:hypothetical protein [Salinibacterium sp. G-O1]MDJ0335422.1 hypothetical protein [Salinibacterium sp. G-O1]